MKPVHAHSVAACFRLAKEVPQFCQTKDFMLAKIQTSNAMEEVSAEYDCQPWGLMCSYAVDITFQDLPLALLRSQLL